MGAVLGAGHYRYEASEDWMRPPEKWTLGETFRRLVHRPREF
jgi:hypothetical protein